MSGVHDDLATLRRGMVRSVDDPDWKGPTEEALDRVEAEIARLEGELTEWRTSIASEKLTWRAEAAEAEVARLRNGIARQLTPLDVATTHVQIIRSKGDDYSAEERDNVAAIVEAHTTEARSALFALLAEEKQ